MLAVVTSESGIDLLSEESLLALLTVSAHIGWRALADTILGELSLCERVALIVLSILDCGMVSQVFEAVSWIDS